FEGVTWFELRPETGRTHQLRVHLAEHGWPILGDAAYGDAGGAMLLHARRIEVPYWADRDPVVVEAPPPPEMAARIAQMKEKVRA
ncbi:MAG TPA: hypothetical protein VKS60_04090, partial [Stellaceae bacterium]|nr:hypothetical protein [Stellaceae bacterium]